MNQINIENSMDAIEGIHSASDCIPPAVEDFAITVFRAAMHREIGKKTQLSRSGFSVVFMPECRLGGRADLSEMAFLAKRQIEHAGIDWRSVSEADVQAYCEWRSSLDHEREVGHARFQVTRIFNEPYNGMMGSCGYFVRVRLIGGLGEVVESVRIECKDRWEPETINSIGGKGAVAHYPNKAAINRAISAMRKEFPLYAKAPVVSAFDLSDAN